MTLAIQGQRRTQRLREEDFLCEPLLELWLDLRDEDFFPGLLDECAARELARWDFEGPLEELLLLEEDLRAGTLAPSRRASESPIAMACFWLFTFFPLRPLFSLPRFISCISSWTFRCAFGPYFLPPEDLREDEPLVAMEQSPFCCIGKPRRMWRLREEAQVRRMEGSEEVISRLKLWRAEYLRRPPTASDSRRYNRRRRKSCLRRHRTLFATHPVTNRQANQPQCTGESPRRCYWPRSAQICAAYRRRKSRAR